MRLLALDTSTECCSAALLLGEEFRLRYELTERGHAERILPMIDSLLAEAGLGLRDLDGLAFGRGPGAFTGLRIATGVVQGLAFGTGLPVAPVSSLAAVACQVPAAAGERVLVCNDARMGEVYWGVFPAGPDAGALGTPDERVSPPEAVWQVAVAEHVAGNALTRYPGLREQLSGAGLRVHEGLWPRADAVARLGARVLREGRGVAAEQAQPVYVRDQVVRTPVTAMS